MQKKYSIFCLVIILFLLSLSCQHLSTQAAGDELIDLASIPASYGNLVAVTSIPAYPEWIQMWFQDTTGTIRVVRVEFITYRMAKSVKEITRSQVQ